MTTKNVLIKKYGYVSEEFTEVVRVQLVLLTAQK